MSCIKDKHLYPLMYALVEHHAERKPIKGVELPEDLDKALGRLPRDRFEDAPADEHALKNAKVKELMTHASSCKDCELMLIEDGPEAKRAKSKAEVKKEEEERVEEVARMKTKFFISLGYAVPSFFAAQYCLNKYRNLNAEQRMEGPSIRSANQQGLKIHPLQIGFFALLLVAAWGVAEAWKIANELWIDWTKAKAAVPVVGKAWAEKSIRAQEELERQKRRGQK